MKGLFTDSDVVRINGRFMRFIGLLSDIWTLIEKQNDLSPIEMYEMVKKTNQEVR